MRSPSARPDAPHAGTGPRPFVAVAAGAALLALVVILATGRVAERDFIGRTALLLAGRSAAGSAVAFAGVVLLKWRLFRRPDQAEDYEEDCGLSSGAPGGRRTG